MELLSDVEKIRAERRKAKANKHKYIGTGNDGFGGGMSFSTGGSRYGGFGSDSPGGGGGGSYGNGEYFTCSDMPGFETHPNVTDYGSYGAGGSGAGGGGRSSFRDEARRGGFEEYNAGDDEVASSPISPGSRSHQSTRAPVRKATAPTPAPAPAPVEDLLGGFGDDDTFGSSNINATTNNGFGGLGMNKELPKVAPPVAIDGKYIR